MRELLITAWVALRFPFDFVIELSSRLLTVGCSLVPVPCSVTMNENGETDQTREASLAGERRRYTREFLLEMKPRHTAWLGGADTLGYVSYWGIYWSWRSGAGGFPGYGRNRAN